MHREHPLFQSEDTVVEHSSAVFLCVLRTPRDSSRGWDLAAPVFLRWHLEVFEVLLLSMSCPVTMMSHCAVLFLMALPAVCQYGSFLFGAGE